MIATDATDGVGLVDELGGSAEKVDVAIVAPVIEHSAVKHAAGDLEPARERAQRRLEAGLAELRAHGIPAVGMLGDTDPLLAAEDALEDFAADEVLIFERSGERPHWYEDGFFERAREALEPSIRMVPAAPRPAEGGRRAARERRAGRGTEPAVERSEVGLAPYLPSFESADLAAIGVGVFGTFVAVAFFAAGPGPQTGAGSAQGLIALAAGLINIAHVIGLTLFESVGYRGGFRSFVRTVTLAYTPAAVVANLAIWLVA